MAGLQRNIWQGPCPQESNQLTGKQRGIQKKVATGLVILYSNEKFQSTQLGGLYYYE